MGLLRRTASYSLVILGLLACAAEARAQGVIDMGGMSDQDAKSHFKVGKSLYETGRFAEAAIEFEKAYQLSNRVELLYNVYVAHRDASDLPKAIDALRRYLGQAELDDSARVNLQARLRAMEEANARAAAPASPAAAAPAPAPAEQPAPAEPPPPAEQPAAVEPAAPGTAELAVEPDSATLPIVLIGIGGGALIAGAITGVMASGKISDIEDACPADMCPPESEFDLEAERDDASTLRTITFALLGGGLVVAGSGVALLLLDSGSSESAVGSDGAPQAAVRCGAHGCMGTVRGRF